MYASVNAEINFWKRNKILLLGILTVVGYWFLESMMDYILLSRGMSYFQLIYDITLHELWTRIMAISLIIVFTMLVHAFYSKESNSKRRIAHLSSILASIRNVNQLITKEKNPKKLIKQSCEMLVETRGFLSAWIALVDGSSQVTYTAEAGIDKGFPLLESQLKQGEIPKCHEFALSSPKAVIIEDPSGVCKDCPLSDNYDNRYVLTSSLTYRDTLYGIMTVSLPRRLSKLAWEKELLQEVASDLAFGMENIKLIKNELCAKKELERSLSRNEFFKDLLAHDINNFLTNIKSPVQLIKMEYLEELPNEVKEFVDMIEMQVERGASLIQNVRQLSEVFESPLERKKMNVVPVLQEAIAHIKGQFGNKEIRIDVSLPESAISIHGGPLLIDAFDNILRNAVIHNPNQEIKIWISLSKYPQNQDKFIRIEFQDNARGISDERKSLIFQKSEYHERQTGGMGIGLSLVKNILEAYGGNIWVEDRISGDHTKGSNFIVLLKKISDLERTDPPKDLER